MYYQLCNAVEYYVYNNYYNRNLTKRDKKKSSITPSNLRTKL